MNRRIKAGLWDTGIIHKERREKEGRVNLGECPTWGYIRKGLSSKRVGYSMIGRHH
jgi:hypothetical protein